jgi:hypothetical protein
MNELITELNEITKLQSEYSERKRAFLIKIRLKTIAETKQSRTRGTDIARLTGCTQQEISKFLNGGTISLQKIGKIIELLEL